MDKKVKDKLVSSPRENGGKIFTQELEGKRRRGKPRKRWKQEVVGCSGNGKRRRRRSRRRRRRRRRTVHFVFVNIFVYSWIDMSLHA